MGDESERKMLVFSLFVGGSATVKLIAELAPSVKGSGIRSSRSGTGVLSSEGTRWKRWSALCSWKSENWSKGSRFVRIVPEKRAGSWGIMARRVRRSWRRTVEMSTPSIVMLPFRASRKRKSASERVDLPTQVRSELRMGEWTYQRPFGQQHRLSDSCWRGNSSLSRSVVNFLHTPLPDP